MMNFPFPAPDPYILVVTGAGILVALVTWLPRALRKLPLSLPIVCIGLGAAISTLPRVSLRVSPLDQPLLAERFSEFVVIIALMGAGLKLDRPFSLPRWAVTWRLLAITMPLGIAVLTVLGGTLLALSWPVALLLAASLAPTDPVLAADVQVGPPQTEEEDEVRFGLTSEAGLNDGLAFPFVHLAIALGALAASGKAWAAHWVSVHVLWGIAAGIVVGWLVGKLFGWLTFHRPRGKSLARTGDGLIALSATFVSYGLGEIVHCYGFLAVFVTAMTLRASHREHTFNVDMHELTEQVERLAMMTLLLLCGSAVMHGLLAPLRVTDVLFVALAIFIVRPLTGILGLAGLAAQKTERWALAFFGIRGVGSIYYLAYGLNHMQTPDPERLWAIVGLAILISILLHGLTVTPAMRWLDRRHGRDPDRDALA
ncbi:cation:proton antiporter [Novosphingobium sp. BL-8H]|uniref:cation:proton antiporter n=1 Tax=Novosphingobium sp. BL-8H TaxID=3127640 RepID=UPI00375805E3